MTVTNSELTIYANQRIPGFEKVRAMAAELLDARQRLERLETELQQAKTAATYGAKMVKDMRGMV
jgi:predicted component of type VI protein secretion system